MPISTLLREVDAVDEFEEAVDEMLARLLAVADDVDAGVLLQLERERASRRAWPAREIGALRAAIAATACSARRAMDGFGRLPATVVGNIMLPCTPPDLDRLRRSLTFGPLRCFFVLPAGRASHSGPAAFLRPYVRIAEIADHALRAAQPINACPACVMICWARSACVPARALS